MRGLQLWLTVELSYFVIQATNVDTALLGIAQKWLGRGRGTKLGIARTAWTDVVWSIHTLQHSRRLYVHMYCSIQKK
jgi:hypothetical protein